MANTENPVARDISKNFGMTFAPEVLFDGTLDERRAIGITTAEGLWRLVDELRSEGASIGRLFVGTSKPVLVIAERRPPLGLLTGLDVKETVRFMAEVTERSGKPIVQFPPYGFIVDLTGPAATKAPTTNARSAGPPAASGCVVILAAIAGAIAVSPSARRGCVVILAAIAGAIAVSPSASSGSRRTKAPVFTSRTVTVFVANSE